MFRSRDIEIFEFLWNLQISKFVTPSQVLLHNVSYTYAYFFRILSPIKMKFRQILVCCMTNISIMFLAESWRLETSSRLFYHFIKYSKIWPFLMVDMYHFYFSFLFFISFIHLSKKRNTGILAYLVIE